MNKGVRRRIYESQIVNLKFTIYLCIIKIIGLPFYFTNVISSIRFFAPAYLSITKST